MEFEHSDLLHAPQVVVSPATPGTNEIHATLFYYNVSVDIHKVDAVTDTVNDIVAFFNEGEEEGLFKVVE